MDLQLEDIRGFLNGEQIQTVRRYCRGAGCHPALAWRPPWSQAPQSIMVVNAEAGLLTNYSRSENAFSA